MIYKTFKKVSNVCQLADKRKYNPTETKSGVTFTNNGDGTITIDGTAIENPAYKEFFAGALDETHKYLFTATTQPCVWGQTYGMTCTGGGEAGFDNGNGKIFTNEKVLSLIAYVWRNNTVSNLTFKPQLFDLTEMYGAGNEPTTVEQFRQDFPEEMYDYSPHCFVTSYKTLLKASDVCQLMDKSKYTGTRTINGVTFTNNGDGTITVNGTATARAIFNIQISNYFPSNLIGHTCLIVPNVSLPTTTDTINIHTTSWEVSNIRPIGKIDIMPDVRISVFPGYTANNLVFRPQFFDLTEMYGAGNEPTSVEQFRQDFPEELYDYKPYSIVNSYKKSLVCKTKNLFDINSVTDIKHVTTNKIVSHTLWSIKNNSLITKINYYDIGACIFLPTLNLEPGTYTLSAYCVSNHPRCFVGIRDFNKSKWFHEAYNTNTQIEYKFEITEKSEIGLMLQGLDSNLIVTFSNIQLELGDTATEYVPYGHL